MNKKVIGRAVSLVFGYLIVVSTFVAMITGIGDERPAETWTVLDALWGIVMLLVFSWAVIDIYQYHREEL